MVGAAARCLQLCAQICAQYNAGKPRTHGTQIQTRPCVWQDRQDGIWWIGERERACWKDVSKGMTRPGRDLSHALFSLHLSCWNMPFFSSPNFPWFWTIITFITSAQDQKCLLSPTPPADQAGDPPLRSLCSQTNQSEQMPVNTLPFIVWWCLTHADTHPSLVPPPSTAPRCSHNSRGPQIPFGHSWTSEAHQQTKGRIYGSLTDQGGRERVGFKEEDKVVVPSYARQRIMMWLSVPPATDSWRAHSWV